MSASLTRITAALCGVLGVVMLTAHFMLPPGVPPDSAGIAEVSTFVCRHRDSLLLSACLQPTGATLYVLFILALVHFAGPTARLAGRVVLLAGAILVTWTLVDTALIISAVQAATQGHLETLRVSFDLVAGPTNDAIGRSVVAIALLRTGVEGATAGPGRPRAKLSLDSARH